MWCVEKRIIFLFPANAIIFGWATFFFSLFACCIKDQLCCILDFHFLLSFFLQPIIFICVEIEIKLVMQLPCYLSSVFVLVYFFSSSIRRMQPQLSGELHIECGTHKKSPRSKVVKDKFPPTSSSLGRCLSVSPYIRSSS